MQLVRNADARDGIAHSAKGMGQEASKPAVGDGSEENPFQISSAEELAWFRDWVNGTYASTDDNKAETHLSACAKLMNNIDMSSVCHAANEKNNQEELSWTPIGNRIRINNNNNDNNLKWYGTFDGNNKTVSNLYINYPNKDNNIIVNLGLFGYVKGGTIKNTTIHRAQVTAYKLSGILAGVVNNNSNLQNIIIEESSIEGYAYIGSIAGNIVNSKVFNCENYAKVKGLDSYIGGIYGYSNASSFSYCRNYGEIYGFSYVGGICGETENKCTFNSCANYGNIYNIGYSLSNYFGGIVGFILYEAAINNCANYGDISACQYVGGIIGYSYSTGDSSTNRVVNINNVFNYGNITGKKNIGLVIGWCDSNTSITENSIIAYNNEATLIVNGETLYDENATALGEGSQIQGEERIKGFYKSQIEVGEVTYILNGKTSTPSDGSTLVWYQKLGIDADPYPVLKAKDNNTVYNTTLTYCDGSKGEYSNNPNGEIITSHTFTIAKLADSETGLYGEYCPVCQTENGKVKYIKNFCNQENHNLKLKVNNDGTYLTEAPFTISDRAEYNSPVDFEVADFSYTRNNPHTEWQVYYVPFDIEYRELANAGFTAAYINNFHEYTKNGETEVVLEVKEITSGTLRANVPYVIRTTESGEKTVHANNVMLHKAEAKALSCQSVTHDYSFKGIYKALSGFNQDENINNGIIDYTLKGGEFSELTKTATLSPMRWYLTICDRNKATETSSAQSARVSNIQIKVVGEGEATGIEDIHVITDGNVYVNHGIYDLQGRRLSAEPAHGVYIKNGKKIIK